MKKDSHYKLSLPDEWQKEDFTAYIALENEEKSCHGTPSGQLSFQFDQHVYHLMGASP